MIDSVSIGTLVWIYMSFWFGVACLLKRNDVADIAWGLGFILVAWSSYFLFGASGSSVIINTLVTIWGVRLATHIYIRNKNKGEDARYQAWRESWGKWFYLRSYFQVFILQGLLLLMVSTPVIFANRFQPDFTSLTLGGIIVWLIGFIFEAVGDVQLSKFKSNPKNHGRVMKYGLWSYTRHPNYFGEVAQWWGIYLMVLPTGWWTIIGPLTITYLILGLSGVPMLEKRYEGNREYDDYKKKVSAFFPRLPRNV